jgi:maltose O-acetyltransferase
VGIDVNLKRLLLLGMYYGFARHLPASSNKYMRWVRVVRRLVCCPLFDHAGENINVEAGAQFGSGRGVSIGDNSGIGVNCSIHGPVRIGCDVMIGPDVVIISLNHEFSDLSVPMIRQGHAAPDPVVIEDDVWIGTRAILLPGAYVARGCIVGAGAVVTKRFESNSIIGGNPARKIASRG